MLDLSHMPDDVKRDAAALLREVWQSHPKTLLIAADPEEEPDDR